MAKQTFTTGQVLTAAQMTSLQQTAMGGGSATAKTTSYVLVAADAGTTVAMNAAGSTTITVNTSLFAAGDVVFIQNLGAGVCTVTAGTATVTTSGSLVLAQNQGGKLYFTSASAAIFFQFATPASSGDIEGVTAGTGISGGGTSGTVTITNSMATAIDAKGDLVAGTGADTFSRLAVGANNTVLTADSAEATGLKWATPTASASGLTLISTTTVSSGTSVNINNVFSATYDNYLIVAYLSATQDLANFQLRAGGTTTTSGYYYAGNQTNSNASGPTGFWGQNLSDIDLREIGTDVGIITIQVNNPYNSVTTTMSATHIMTNLTRIHTSILGGGVNNSTSYDGFTISLDAGGFSSAGKIRVYGYANS